MPQLVVKINERNYQISCQEGEEERVQNAAARIDSKIASLKSNMGKASTELLYITCLLMMEDDNMNSKGNSDSAGKTDSNQGSDKELKKLLNLVTEDLGSLVISEK
jgi:cell division protein ZapA